MLRDYQQLALDQIRAHWLAGRKRVLLRMPTGSGKTVIFCTAMKSASEKLMENVMVVRGRKLVDQASQRLFREEVNHGVLMRGHWNVNKLAKAQVCSVDTVISRQEYPPAKLVAIDEAHLATSDGFLQFVNQYPDAFFLSVTATPYTEKSLRHLCDAIVHPISMIELIKQGYLVGFRYFAPNEPDLQGVKIVNKDYKNDQLETRMQTLTGDIVSHWERLGQGRPTLGFAVNIHHSKTLVDMCRGHGISAEHCDADTSDEERNAIIKRLETGQTKIVWNVGIFCTGVDILPVGCIILARPTKSFTLFVQQTGRGTRPFYPDKADTIEDRLTAIANSVKPDCIILDHAGNIGRLGFPTEEPEVTLEGKVRRKSVNTAKICKKCFIVYDGPSCPQCGPMAKDVVAIEVTEGELIELGVSRNKTDVEIFLDSLMKKRSEKGYKMGWVYYKLIEKFGEEKCKPHLPHWWGKKTLEPVEGKLSDWITPKPIKD